MNRLFLNKKISKSRQDVKGYYCSTCDSVCQAECTLGCSYTCLYSCGGNCVGASYI